METVYRHSLYMGRTQYYGRFIAVRQFLMMKPPNNATGDRRRIICRGGRYRSYECYSFLKAVLRAPDVVYVLILVSSLVGSMVGAGISTFYTTKDCCNNSIATPPHCWSLFLLRWRARKGFLFTSSRRLCGI